jgi:hypothetical protein
VWSDGAPRQIDADVRRGDRRKAADRRGFARLPLTLGAS